MECYGRGAADMKGSLQPWLSRLNDLCMLIRNIVDVLLLITSDEEADAHDGTVKVVESLISRERAT